MSDGCTSFLVCLCDVEGACSKIPFYRVFGSSTRFCVVSWVFGWVSLYNANYRCLVCKGGHFVGARIADCSVVDGCFAG